MKPIKQLHANEGPNPEGVAARLRRERDEARVERDQLGLEVASLRDQLADQWTILCETCAALEVAKHQDQFGLVPLRVIQKLHANICADTTGYERIFFNDPRTILKLALADLDYLGWSQAHLAEELGVHRNTVSRWLTGKTELPRYAFRFIRLAVLIKELAKEIEP